MEQDVLRLEVPVDDTLPMRIVERTRYGRRDANGFIDGELLLAVESRAL